MAYTTELTQDCVGIVHAGSGILTGEELLAASVSATHLVQNTENFQYEFSDFTDVTEIRTTPELVEQLVLQDHVAAKWRPNAIIVVVAPSDQAFALAQQWNEKISDLDWTIHLSRERDEAVQWLAQHLKSERPELLAVRRADVA